MLERTIVQPNTKMKQIFKVGKNYNEGSDLAKI